MGHVGEKLRLVTVGGLDLTTLILNLTEQPGVLNRQCRLRSEGFQKINHFRAEFPRRLPTNDETANDTVFAQERNRENGSDSRLGLEVSKRRVIGISLQNIRDLYRLTGLCRTAHRAFAHSRWIRPKCLD